MRFRAHHLELFFILSCIAALQCREPVTRQRGIPSPPRHGDVYVVAHRGAHLGIPENTLAAYRKAIEIGVDFVEIDVRTTADHHLVSIHNGDIDTYVTDGTGGEVADMTLTQLRALDIGSRVDPGWRDEKIPTFEEILQLCDGAVGIYLDLKDADVDTLVQMVRSHNMTGQVLWYASPQELLRVAEICPECLIMPDPGPEENLPLLIETFHPRIIAAVWRHCSQSFVQTCHRAGALAIVDESDSTCWRDALAWGCDGIQTDTPAHLIAYLRSRN